MTSDLAYQYSSHNNFITLLYCLHADTTPPKTAKTTKTAHTTKTTKTTKNTKTTDVNAANTAKTAKPIPGKHGPKWMQVLKSYAPLRQTTS